MKYLLLMALTGCYHPVTNHHWENCEEVCLDKEGPKEACVSYKGEGCTCYDETTIWIVP
jgi:hypothetical protein